ncbi:hypothetical protein FACS189449_07490 [Alphaproteobacteria bacterium]|nr:hypothetical protein FACS189449_07490 [Alphaproteobacteria bacterium]
MKTEIRITKKGRIMHVSKTVPGTVHDFKLWKDSQEIPSEKIPIETHVLGDSGYQGIEKIHKNSEIPKKKPKGGKLRNCY